MQSSLPFAFLPPKTYSQSFCTQLLWNSLATMSEGASCHLLLKMSYLSVLVRYFVAGGGSTASNKMNVKKVASRIANDGSHRANVEQQHFQLCRKRLSFRPVYADGEQESSLPYGPAGFRSLATGNEPPVTKIYLSLQLARAGHRLPSLGFAFQNTRHQGPESSNKLVYLSKLLLVQSVLECQNP